MCLDVSNKRSCSCKSEIGIGGSKHTEHYTRAGGLAPKVTSQELGLSTPRLRIFYRISVRGVKFRGPWKFEVLTLPSMFWRFGPPYPGLHVSKAVSGKHDKSVLPRVNKPCPCHLERSQDVHKFVCPWNQDAPLLLNTAATTTTTTATATATTAAAAAPATATATTTTTYLLLLTTTYYYLLLLTTTTTTTTTTYYLLTTTYYYLLLLTTTTTYYYLLLPTTNYYYLLLPTTTYYYLLVGTSTC